MASKSDGVVYPCKSCVAPMGNLHRESFATI